MPSYVALQPNGKLAVFSSIVDDFTYLNCEASQLREMFCQTMGRSDAQAKVQRGLDDEEIWPGENVNRPHHRWKEGLQTIRLIHGQKRLDEFLAENAACLGGP